MNTDKHPIYVFITPSKDTSLDEINLLTKEIGQTLASFDDKVSEISYVGRERLPKGAKSLELLFTEQVVIQLIPIVTPWLLGKLDTTIKSIAKRKNKHFTSTVQVGSHEIQISPETTIQELQQYKQIVDSAESLSGKRYALIIGNSEYIDSALPTLNSAGIDAKTFSSVLQDTQIGAFSEVTTLINKDSHIILQSIENFFQNRHKDDLLLLYFSGHGIKTKRGQLFLATRNTTIDLVLSTGISSNFIKENMDASNSQRQILILDCCYSGAIVEGAKSEQSLGQSINSVQAFLTSGFGRVIIAASESMQFAFDGKRIEGYPENSLFTQHLIEGLRTGNADFDNDGLVDIEELYQYAYNNVIPKQTPNISTTAKKGKIFISINPNPIITPAELPQNLLSALKSDDRLYKQGAISDLKLLLENDNARISMAAKIKLEEMTSDDSLSIRKLAQETLEQHQSKHLINKKKLNSTTQANTDSKTNKTNSEAQSSNITSPTGNTPPSMIATQPVLARNPNPFLAAGLSFFLFGGTGQLYIGQWKKGLLIILVYLFCLIQFSVLVPIVILIGLGDAYGTAVKQKNGNTLSDWSINIHWKATGLVAVLIIASIIFLAMSLLLSN